ncbi:von Willebrand factor A domain-containing protein 5A-like isoform X3 [Syngnathoides biaculeatus]|uniref:von Willebrand factor A domain-containing protein 5A-like isoform X3 n=1 Tax=Syngnathoides biaculeatus TaxID=300417 RepID=UPI002ADE2249|nr:von Willebrand factor A domain-containing protein 5A-like isoform X3 [Syngnathoides biaculeatus]
MRFLLRAAKLDDDTLILSRVAGAPEPITPSGQLRVSDECCVLLGCGKKTGVPTQARGEHANSTRSGVGIRTRVLRTARPTRSTFRRTQLKRWNPGSKYLVARFQREARSFPPLLFRVQSNTLENSTPRAEVPLMGIEAEVEVKDHVATAACTLRYENEEDKAIEAVFVFPLPADAAVCHFSAKMGRTEVVAEVKEKTQAREEYDDALSSGQRAFLLEESEQSPDIFSLSVGSLPPGESASIRLEYVVELAVEADGGLRFCLPAVLNPRYRPPGSEVAGVQVTSVPASLVPYSLSFSARVSSPRRVSKVDSDCSLEPLQYLNEEQTQALVKLSAGHKFDRDVELLIYYEDAHRPTAVVEAGKASAEPGTLMGDAVVMLSLYPEFPPEVTSSLATSGEFVFLLDRSGSMDCPLGGLNQSETRISSARDTLLLLLKSLPLGCYFNIYSFGSSFEHVFPKSREYTETTVEAALKKVEEMQANLGGTEILGPLKHIYGRPRVPGHPRRVFVFTDGEVTNTKEVTSLVKKHSASHRCFSFGIGQGASTALVDGLAKEGGGHAQFVAGADRMQTKVMQSLQFALQPAAEDVSLSWDLPEGTAVALLSPPLANIFHGQRAIVYAQLTGQSPAQPAARVTVKYILAGRPLQSELGFSVQPAEDRGLTVHRLGAQSLIRDLERKETAKDGEVKKKVVEVSIQSGVSSSFTAFVAIDKGGGGGAVRGPLLRRPIPIASLHCPTGVPVKGMKTKMKKGGKGLFMNALATAKMPIFGCSSVRPTVRNAEKPLPAKEEERGGEAGTRRSSFQSTAVKTAVGPPPDPVLQLVSLQKASGHWEQNPPLAAALHRTAERLERAKPAEVSGNVWATVLALVWLHGFKSGARVEWKLLAGKAVSWLLSRNVSNMTECVSAANTLLGCNVQKDVLGL